MTMNDFNDMPSIKFLIVLGKMYASVFGKVEKHIKELSLNTTEFLIMYAIAAHGALTIQAIASKIFVTSGNMTYTIDKLEQRGLLRRIRCEEDRRKIYIDFTEAGKAKWDTVMAEHMTYMNETFSSIDEETLLQTIEAMKYIGKNIEH